MTQETLEAIAILGLSMALGWVVLFVLWRRVREYGTRLDLHDRDIIALSLQLSALEYRKPLHEGERRDAERRATE
jgi:hypothetical protein